MATVFFRFYAELNQLLPDRNRFSVQIVHFMGQQSVKHLIESQGVPHTEVDLILANGRSVGFDHIPNDGELISVYPLFQSLNICTLTELRPVPLPIPKFILDGHLGRLASYLRMLGFDVSYRNDYTDEKLAHTSFEENRILLTRDRGLLKRSLITYGFLIRTTDPFDQLQSVITRFQLKRLFKPYSRCMRCNGLLERINQSEIVKLLEPKTRKYFHRFKRCSDCAQIYWAGSHRTKMDKLIRKLRMDESSLTYTSIYDKIRSFVERSI